MDRSSAASDPVVEFRGILRRGENALFSVVHHWPFGKLRASPEQLVFDADLTLRRPIVLPRERVRRIHLAGLFGKALRFEHTASLQPEYVVFGVWNIEHLRGCLQELGWPVD